MNVSDISCDLFTHYCMISCYVGKIEFFISAVTLVMQDEGFELPSVQSQKARQVAHKMLSVVDSETRHEDVLYFVIWILEKLAACCSHERAMTCHSFKERMWEKFYQLSIQEEFRKRWTTFIELTTGYDANPIFYQFVTRTMFEELIKLQLPIGPLHPNVTAAKEASQPCLDYHEKNGNIYSIAPV